MRRTNSETLDILSQWSHLVETREDIAEEIETLMLRLETVFKSYHDKTIVNNHQKQTMREFDGGSWELQQIVAEIADQIQVRPYTTPQLSIDPKKFDVSIFSVDYAVRTVWQDDHFKILYFYLGFQSSASTSIAQR